MTPQQLWLTNFDYDGERLDPGHSVLEIALLRVFPTGDGEGWLRRRRKWSHQAWCGWAQEDKEPRKAKPDTGAWGRVTPPATGWEECQKDEKSRHNTLEMPIVLEGTMPLPSWRSRRTSSYLTNFHLLFSDWFIFVRFAEDLQFFQKWLASYWVCHSRSKH